MSLFKTFGKLAKVALRASPLGGLVPAADSVRTTRRVQAPFYSSEETTTMYDHSPVGGPGMAMVKSGAGCPIGFRLNKSVYVTRGGGTSKWPRSLQVHAKGTVCVKRRRRNVGNAKALRRAISRVRGFVHLAHRAMRLVGPRKSRGRKQLAAPIEVVRTG